MKSLKDYISEDFSMAGNVTYNKTYEYYPKSKEELKSLIKQLLDERGDDADLNDIDTSAITDMSLLFSTLDPHNIDISEWNVSNVTNIEALFYGCKYFNSDLSHWDVSNVTNMRSVFSRCKNFNSDLSKWDVSKVTDISWMFNGCENFNCDLSNWNPIKLIGSNSKYMMHAFRGCLSLKNKPSWYKE